MASRAADRVLAGSKISSSLVWPVGGVVHSVFPHAVNLCCGQDLVSVVTPSVGGVPNGVVLRDEIDLTQLVHTEDAVTCREQVLRVGELCIDPRQAEPWDPVLRLRGRLPPWRCLDVPVEGGFAPLLRGVPAEQLRFPAREAAPRIATLVAAVRADDGMRMSAAAQTLVGLGVGLTPSGDDFLVGFAAALRFAGRDLPRYQYAGTTDVARMFHMHAQRGEFSERIHELFETWDFERAARWGATSGADCVLGVLAASVACDTDSQLPF